MRHANQRKIGAALATIAAMGLLGTMAVEAWAAGGTGPIVAVLEVEVQGIRGWRSLRNRLSAHVTTTLGATGKFRVVPGPKLRRRLSLEKAKGYKSGYDESTQVESGKQLAPQKSLLTTVIRLGKSCKVAMVMLDVGKAASDGGVTTTGGCAEEDIVESIEETLRLTIDPSAKQKPKKPVMPRSAVGTNAIADIDFQTEPKGAEVFVDAQMRGRTPLRLRLRRGFTYRVSIEKDGFEKVKVDIPVKGRATHEYALKLPLNERIRTQTEWFALRGFMGAGPNISTSFMGVQLSDPTLVSGGEIALFTLRWERFTWELLRLGGATPLGYFWGSAVSYPLHIGDSGMHEIRFGGHLTFAWAYVPSASGVQVSYVWHMKERFALEFGVMQFTYPFAVAGTLGFRI
jgi:hypothetical protein